MDRNKEIRVARELAVQAGTKILEIYSREFHVEEKDDNQGPVTEADLASDRLICTGLEKAFPGDGILSEERVDDSTRLQKTRVWCVDPLDGTRDFLRKNGEFAVHIGLIEAGRPVLGIVYLPAFGRLYWGGSGLGAFRVEGRKETPLKTRDVRDPARLVRVGSRSHRDSAYMALVHSLESAREIVHGSVGAKVGLIADSRADYLVYPGSSTKEWDLCAPEALLAGAGGQASDLEGNPLFYNKEIPKNPKGVLASNGSCHEFLLGKIRENIHFFRAGKKRASGS